MATRTKSSGKTTIKIPTPLYRKIALLIEGAGYNSVTDFVVYVLRDVVGERGLETVGGRRRREASEKAMVEELETTWKSDLERAKQKLRNLGYL